MYQSKCHFLTMSFSPEGPLLFKSYFSLYKTQSVAIHALLNIDFCVDMSLNPTQKSLQTKEPFRLQSGSHLLPNIQREPFITWLHLS